MGETFDSEVDRSGGYSSTYSSYYFEKLSGIECSRVHSKYTVKQAGLRATLHEVEPHGLRMKFENTIEVRCPLTCMRLIFGIRHA